MSELTARLRGAVRSTVANYTTYDALCTEAADEIDRVIKEHADCIDYYEAKLVECERKLDEAYASLAEGDKRYAAEVERLTRESCANWIDAEQLAREIERLRGLLRESHVWINDVRPVGSMRQSILDRIDAALGTASQPGAAPCKCREWELCADPLSPRCMRGPNAKRLRAAVQPTVTSSTNSPEISSGLVVADDEKAAPRLPPRAASSPYR